MTVGQRVPDAISEWWVGPTATALTSPDRTVFGAISSSGQILACEMDHTTGLSSRTVVARGYVDDHNTPALWVADGRRPVIVWSQHGSDNYLRVKAGNVDSIASLESASTVSVDMGGGVSYSQVHKIEALSDADTDVLWVFCRVTLLAWYKVTLSVSQATGAVTASAPVQVLSAAGQTYISTADAHASTGQVIRFAWGYNPASSLSAVRYVEIDAVTGAISSPVDPTVSANISGAGLPLIDESVGALLPEVGAGRSRRLFYARPGPALAAVAYAEWDESTPDAATYYVTARSGTGWTTTEYGTAGPRLGYTDTANYIAGMAFPNPCIDDRVAVARQVDGLSSVDMYVGDTSTQLAASATTRLARPAFPINGDPTRVIASDVSYYGASYTDYASDIVALFDDTGSDVVTSGTQQVTILCGELRTGRILSTVPVSAASWEQVHRDAGSIEITVPVTSAEVQAMPDLLSCLEGPAFYLAVQKGEQIMEAGPIWAWSYDGVSSLRVAAAGLWSLWDHRKVMKVLASGENPAETSLGWSGLSLATLAKRLIVSAMAHTGGSLPVVLPADIVGTSEREWPGYQLATVADEVRAIMGVIGGPDVAFEPRLTPDNLSIEWVMRTGTTSAPLLHQSGSDWQWDTTVVRGGVAGLSVDRDWSSMTMRGWAVGEGQDEASLMSMRQDLTLTDAGYPLLEQDQSFTSVSVQSTLDRHAEAVVAANRRAWQTWGMTVEADEVPRPGDWCRVWISKSHPVLGRLARSAPYYRARLLKVSGDLTDFVKLTMAPTMDAR